MVVNKFFITQDIPIREAIEQLDQTAKKILLVVDQEKLIGIVTDGDIRRWILKNGDFSSPVCAIMNTSPISLRIEDKLKGGELMKKYSIEAIPLVSDKNEVVDILFWNEADNSLSHNDIISETPVVIMAGGKGTRLYPYTKIVPKPLIPIGDISIVERIMNQFIEYKFKEFYLTINYKKEMIKAYFNGELPYHLNFLEEEKPMGTAGALVLAKDYIKDSFFVSNCDILVDINYADLLLYHKTRKHKLTIVTAIKTYEIPYGVVTLGENGCIETLSEKPKYEMLVNTGLYVLEEEILKYIPSDQYFDMTDLIKECLIHGEQVGAYPVMDSTWLDMGEFEEMKNMAERLKL
ncbi:MAG: nucleotidyltransferase family protein [Lachnotalea sp.]